MTDDLLTGKKIGEPELKDRRGISPVWILPLVALIIAGWLVYRSIADAGINVVITFASAQGLRREKPG